MPKVNVPRRELDLKRPICEAEMELLPSYAAALSEAVHIRISRFELLGADPFEEGFNWLAAIRQYDTLQRSKF